MSGNGPSRTSELERFVSMVGALSTNRELSGGETPAEVIQTHISTVLVGEEKVLKLKKPVDFGFLDYSTLELRRLACEAEVRLNSRLCPEIYLGVQPIRSSGSSLGFEGTGEIVDFGVLMRRLPAESMLDHIVRSGRVSETTIERIATRLAGFHRAAESGPSVSVFGSEKVIRANWRENFEQSRPFVGSTLTAETFDTIESWVAEWIATNRPLLLQRVEAERIRDGHGDVRCESICVTDSICIFDCIEFNDRFRCGDVASEVAFLSMDLAAKGRPDLGYHFSDAYVALSGDESLWRLLPFYHAYRAFVRGKVLSFQLAEPEISPLQKRLARDRARSYFDLARRYASRLERPIVLVVSGLSGTGKTAVARAIGHELGLRVVSSDAVRKSLFETTKGSSYSQGAYDVASNRATYDAMFDAARVLLNSGEGVVLDATFRRRVDRDLTRELADSVGATFAIVECVAPDETVRERLRDRARRGDGLSDADWSVYSQQKAEFDTVSSSSNHMRLDTRRTILEVGQEASDWLRSIP